MKLRHLLSTTVCSFSSTLLVAPAAFAHEGHGNHDDVMDGVLHWGRQWDHIAVLALAIALLVWGVRKRVRSHAERDRNNSTR